MVLQRFALFFFAAVAAVAAGADIHEAVRSDVPSRIQEALDAGEDIDKIGPGGQTPLMHGVLQGFRKSVKFLLEKGADTSIGEKDGYTPIHRACWGAEKRHMKTVKALLKANVSPE